MSGTAVHRVSLGVTGMTCDDCAHHVTGAIESAGGRDVAVDWRRGTAQFTWVPEVDDTALRDAIVAAGYRPGALETLGSRSTGALERGHGQDFDLVVLGAGSAAFAAAIKASDAGYRVALVEHGTLGGTCVNVGCVPSKALLRAGEAAWAAGHHRFAGLTTTSGPVDLRALVAQKDELVDRLRQVKYADLVADYDFTVVPGHARFTGPSSIAVDGRPLSAPRFLVATGSTPSIPPIAGLADAGYLTSTTALEQTTVPRRLAVIGASAVGLELGQFFVHLGAQVHLVDIAERVSPFEEPEASEALAGALGAQGATVHSGATIHAVRRIDGHLDLDVEAGGRQYTVVADEVLVATGRRPNTADLDLEAAGVTTDERGALVVDAELRTTNPAIYGAGDVTGAPQFVSVSAYEGAMAADNALLGTSRTTDFTGLPRVIFTSPQLAGAGLTEAQARRAGYDVVTSVLPVDAVPRALVNRDTHGVVKLVAEAGTGRLLGATVVADGAGDVIEAAVLAIRHRLTTDDIASTFHPYLTMAEGLKLAAQAFTRDVHKLSCCAA